MWRCLGRISIGEAIETLGSPALFAGLQSEDEPLLSQRKCYVPALDRHRVPGVHFLR